ncbi:MAG TPA: hypothetical protein VFM46_01765 [Pseudomonadales bacterium]|nr:hypothetical protein [Pseudomonadales bacterium]
MRDDKGYAYAADETIDVKGKLFQPLVLHHASAFAVTRWTNLYFPVRHGLGGDFIGGPLRNVYGLGIKDIPVHCPQLENWHNHSPLAHTEYWHSESDQVRRSAGNKETESALDALRKALSLEQLRKYVIKPQKAQTFKDDVVLED